MAGVISLAEEIFQTIGVAGVAALWGVKVGVTAVFYRIFQKKTGYRSPDAAGWLRRQVARLRIAKVTNGH